MNKDAVFKLMDEIPFFQDMDSNDREVLWNHPDCFKDYKIGENLLSEGEVDLGFFVLLQGKISVVRTQPTTVTLAQLVPGAIFGEVTLKGKRIRTSSIVADEEVVALKVDQNSACEIEPRVMSKVKDQIIDLLINRLDEVNRKLGTFIR